MKVSKAGAFSLTELLVVIAIITVLAAVLFPVLATARDKAQDATCVSNERQLGTAFHQYLSDYDGYFPVGSMGRAGNPGNGIGWAGQLYPYVKSVGLFQCPEDTKSGDTFYVTPYPHLSYAYNEALTEATASSKGAGTHESYAKLTAPDVTVELFEVAYSCAAISSTNPKNSPETNSCAGFGRYFDGGSFLYGLNKSGAEPGSTGGANSGPKSDCTEDTGTLAVNKTDYTAYSDYRVPVSTLGRHDGGSNFLLCDGHVKWLLGSKVSPGASAETANDPEDQHPKRSWSLYTAAGTAALSPNLSATFSPN